MSNQVSEGNPVGAAESSLGMPIIADADTGGGNALNVRRTVLDLIAAGASGCIIEDQQWPKRCGHSARTRRPSRSTRCSRRCTPRARHRRVRRRLLPHRAHGRAPTSAKTGLDMAIERANAYVAAGADGSYIEAPRTTEELKRIGQETVGPRVANMIEGSFTPDHSLEELHDMGFQIVLRPLSGVLAATRALRSTYGALQEGGSLAGHEDDLLAGYDELREVLRLKSYFDVEDRYYDEERLPKTRNLNTRVGKSYPVKSK